MITKFITSFLFISLLASQLQSQNHGFVIDPLTGQQVDGIRVVDVPGDGLHIEKAGTNGVFVQEATQDGFFVFDAKNHGFHVFVAREDAIFVRNAEKNGVFIDEVDSVGILINNTHHNGLQINDAMNNGVVVNSAYSDGIRVAKAHRGMQVDEASFGVSVSEALLDGVYVVKSGRNGLVIEDADESGVVVFSAQDDGIWVGRAEDDGVQVLSAGDNGMYIKYANSNGIQIDSANADGIEITDVRRDALQINSAGDNEIEIITAGGDGIHVSDADEFSMNIQGDKNLAATPENHIAQIYNKSSLSSPDVLALKVGTNSNPTDASNFITFFKGDDTPLGRIEGNGSGGVTYGTTGADFAEELLIKGEANVFQPGDIIGVKNGQISFDIQDADHVMIISDRPAVLGNQKSEDNSLSEKVSFVGQVPVNVIGPVKSGDWIVPSGENNGVGIAIPTEKLTLNHRIVGQAWETNLDPKLKKVNCAVGLDQSEAKSSMLQNLQKQIKKQQHDIEQQMTINENLSNQINALRELVMELKNE